MSNPAVVKLVSGKVGRSNVWMDDNFGESIHLHIDDIRVDLSVSEFEQLSDDVYDILNNLSPIKDFDFRKIDPVFLEVMLWERLPHLKKIKEDKIKLGDLIAPYNEKMFRLENSVGVRALRGESKENEGYRKSHHLNQTDEERMNYILDSIKTHGYPYDNQFIVLYGDDNIIRDGQHRASCLYYLYGGDVEIPVMRYYFDDYVSPYFHKYYNSWICVYYRKVKGRLLYTKQLIRRIANRIKRF